MRASRVRIKDYISNLELLERSIGYLPTSIDESRDLTSLSIWGVLNNIDKENLLELISYYKGNKNNSSNTNKLDPKVKKHIKKVGIKVIRFMDSLGIKKRKSLEIGENNELLKRIGNSGVSLEYFLIDIISRKTKSIGFKIDKGPLECDGKKIDFIVKTDNNIKFGIQLTLSEQLNAKGKRSEMEEKRNHLNLPKSFNEEKVGMSVNFIPDIPVLMIVNSETSRQTNKNGILKKAYVKWRDDGFRNGGPINYLEDKIKNELLNIGTSFPKIIKEVTNFIKKNKNLQNYSEIKINLENPNGTVHIINDGEKIKASYFMICSKGKETFIYSLEFFTTNIFMKKIKA